MSRLVLGHLRLTLGFPLDPDVLEVVHLLASVLDTCPATARLLGWVNDLLAVDSPGTGIIEYQPSLYRADFPHGQEVTLESVLS